MLKKQMKGQTCRIYNIKRGDHASQVYWTQQDWRQVRIGPLRPAYALCSAATELRIQLHEFRSHQMSRALTYSRSQGYRPHPFHPSSPKASRP